METLTMDQFMVALGRNSLQAGVVVLAVLLAQGLSGKRLAPRWRCALWLLVVMRLLVPFSLGSAASIFNLLPSWTQPATAGPLLVETSFPLPEINSVPAVSPVRSSEPQMNQSPALIPMSEPPGISPAATVPSITAITPVSTADRMLAARLPEPRFSWLWPAGIFWAWFAGAAVLLGHVLISSIRLARRCSRMRPLTEPVTLAVLEDCRERLAVSTQLVIVESVEVSSPALHGLFRPRLLLPKGFIAKFSPDELRFVFLHELAHLKRHDLWMNWVMALLQAVHWFNPLVWFGFARWRDDRELACDAMVLEAAGAERNKEYGRTILRLLENFTQPLRTPGLVGILEDKRQLRRRIGMIANYAPSPRWSLLALVLIGALTLIGLTDARSDDATSSPSSVAASKSGTQLTIELRDGSRVVGKTLDEALSFHSAALGEMKLAWAGIRSLEYSASPDTARLTATNGDAFTVQLAKDTLSLETGFGKTDLAVKLIKSIKVTPPKMNVPATPIAAGETGSRLTIELRDGSHVVGKGLDDSLNFHSNAMGDLKLTWAGIRSLEYASANTDTARLIATNGDMYEVQFAVPAVRVETSFGKSGLPVKLIRSLKVSAMTSPGQLPSGLVAVWSGEGDGIDSVGGNNMTMTGISFTDGKVGQAFSFNGSSSQIRIPASSSLNVGLGDGFTIAAWINPANAKFQEIFNWNQNDGSPSDAAQIGVLMEINDSPGDGSLWGNVVDTSGVSHSLYSENGVITPNSFQHIAMTYDKTSGLAVLYRNGVEVAKANLGVFTPQTSFDLFLGNRPSGVFTGIRFQGKLDEPAIYNRALSETEIQTICTDQNNGVAPARAARRRILSQ